MSSVLVGALLGSTVAYLKKIGKIPYTLEESLKIIMGRPIGDDVTWNNDVEVIGDEVEWKAPAPKQTKVKFPRAKADKIVKKVEKHLKPYVDKMMACGSYRRGAQMIGDIDFVVILKDGYTLPEILPANQGVNWVGDQKAQVIIDGEKVDFRVTTPKAWGATILYFTGPADFNIKYRWMAKKRGLKLSEYGLFDRNTDKYIAGKTENDIFTAMGRPYRDPADRKGFQRSAKKKAEDFSKEKFFELYNKLTGRDPTLKSVDFGDEDTGYMSSINYFDITQTYNAPYQPNQTLIDYSPQDLTTSSVVTGDFTTDSLKYGFGPTALSSETFKGEMEEYPSQEIDNSFTSMPNMAYITLPNYEEAYYWTSADGNSRATVAYDDEKEVIVIPNFEVSQRVRGQKRASEYLEQLIEESHSEFGYYPVQIVDVDNHAVGFWEKMENQGAIDGWTQGSFAAEDNYDATYGKEQAKIRRRLKKKIMKQAIMGTKAGQWSARKSQELKRQYEAACEKRGLRAYKGNKTQKQKDLSDWSRQKWGTASGKKSSKTGEPYFPAKAIEALKDRGLYAKAKRQKAAATKAGKQHARYSDDIREVVKPFRAEEQFPICPLCHGYIPNDKTPGAYPGAMSRVFENMEICSACGTAEAVGPMFGPMQDIMDEAKEQGLSGLDLWAYTISNVKEYLPKELYGSESFKAEYEPIGIMEMDRYLQNKRFSPVNIVYRNRPVKEWVYERGLLGVPNHYVRVYTSINRYGRNQGRARDSGRDAIRVQVIYRDDKGETLVSAPKRVHRVGNWKNNLQKRLDVIAEELPKVMFDSRGEPMTLRKYKGNYFWGSRDYPAHKETRRYESESEIELSWQVVVVADTQDNNFYQAYQKVIEADNYNEIWEIVELVDDLNLATNKIADTKFNERRIIVTVYTPGVGLTAKDDYWCEEFDEMLETL